MRRKILTMIAIMMMAGLTACATPVKHDTPSGKAEATIRGTSATTVKNRLTDLMLNKGYTVTRSDDLVVAFDKPIDNALAAAFLGSKYDSTPNARISYNLIQSKGAVRVVADCMAITNPGSAHERKTSFNDHADTLNVQRWLNDIKASLEKKGSK